MTSAVTFLLWWAYVFTLCQSAAQEKRIITTEAGKDVILPCGVPNNKNIIVVEWSRTDLGEEYVLLYRDGQIYLEGQHPSYKNRVDLQDSWMKDGNVSLSLKNVTTDDGGTYECRVVQRGTNRRKRGILKTEPISSRKLEVSPSGNQAGGGNGNSRGHPGLLPVGMILAAAVVAAGFLISKRQKKKTSDPPPDAAAVQQLV
ncbi:coxsackievirus and adenovirus receptor homolog [Leuresthes tenuis]|uniref:coxsackievirus and adenovirus receptor homolog n=1 Tax=Leuresthes tenuis TaxID=355514 RepID=UPI003B50B547